MKNKKSMQGKQITREQAYKGLGDPSTWEKDAKKLEEEFKKKPEIKQLPEIELQLEIFYKLIEKCLDNASDIVKNYSISYENKKNKKLFFREIVYKASFNHNDLMSQDADTKLEVRLFRFLNEEELVNAIFNTLSSNSVFCFDFNKGKFVKKMIVYG